MMRIVASIVPTMTVVIALAAALVPWGVSGTASPVFAWLIPLIPLAVVHYWLVRRPSAMPFAVVFAAGVTVDVATASPLGFWALVYLVGAAVILVAGATLRESAYGRFIAFAGGFVLIGAVAWLLASGYAFERIDIEPLLGAIGLVILAYPVLAVLLRPVAGGRRRRPNPTLVRGR